MKNPVMFRFANSALLPALLFYALASLLHFIHNAEFLAAYPHLPDWITRTSIYMVWWVIFGAGVIGLVLYRAGRFMTGLTLLTIYTALGLDGLLHYTVAPIHAHSLTMNLTIWAEAVTAAVALCVTLGLALYHVRLSAHSLTSTFTYERPSAPAARAQERRTSTHREP